MASSSARGVKRQLSDSLFGAYKQNEKRQKVGNASPALSSLSIIPVVIEHKAVSSGESSTPVPMSISPLTVPASEEQKDDDVPSSILQALPFPAKNAHAFFGAADEELNILEEARYAISKLLYNFENQTPLNYKARIQFAEDYRAILAKDKKEQLIETLAKATKLVNAFEQGIHMDARLNAQLTKAKETSCILRRISYDFLLLENTPEIASKLIKLKENNYLRSDIKDQIENLISTLLKLETREAFKEQEVANAAQKHFEEYKKLKEQYFCEDVKGKTHEQLQQQLRVAYEKEFDEKQCQARKDVMLSLEKLYLMYTLEAYAFYPHDIQSTAMHLITASPKTGLQYRGVMLEQIGHLLPQANGLIRTCIKP